MWNQSSRRGIDSEPDVCVYPKQRGVIIFCNTNPNIALIKGDDGKIYATTDHTTLQDVAENANISSDLQVTFMPVVGMGNHSACSVEVIRSTTTSANVFSTIPNTHVARRPISSGQNADNTLDALIQDRLFQKYEAQSEINKVERFQWQDQSANKMGSYGQTRVPFGSGPQAITQYNSVDSRNRAPHSNNQNNNDYLNIGNRFTTNQGNTTISAHPAARVEENNSNALTSSHGFSNITHNTPSAANDIIREPLNFQTMSEEDLHRILNNWYHIPEMLNKDTYPFPCEGFIVLSNNGSDLMVFTRRLGCIIRKEDPMRKGRPYAYFLVCGPNNYRAWEYEDRQPASFKSTKYVNAQNIETKGYALMAPGDRNDPESMWYAWNDQTGFMRCLSNSARVLKKKYSNWAPTCQMVMFDATSTDNGRHWTIKTISYIDFTTANQQNLFPAQAYYIEKLYVMSLEHQRDTKEEIVFYSEMLKSKVYAKLAHVKEPPKSITPNVSYYSGIIITSWGHDGLGRKYHALMAAPESYWARSNFADVSRVLYTPHWDRPLEAKELLQKVVSRSQPSLANIAQSFASNEEEW